MGVMIRNRAKLLVRDIQALEAEIGTLQSLSAVLKWGRGQPANFEPTVITDVVKQDECTQDAIVPWQGGRVLVFGST
jgi:hypothetical protein